MVTAGQIQVMTPPTTWYSFCNKDTSASFSDNSDSYIKSSVCLRDSFIAI